MMPTVVEAFIEFARRYSHAQRRAERMGAQGNRNEIEDAISQKQEIEQEVAECFLLVRAPGARPGGRR